LEVIKKGHVLNNHGTRIRLSLVIHEIDQEKKASQTRTLSLVIPVFNEEENVQKLFETIVIALERLGHPWEVLFIDDGSSDSSYDHLAQIAKDNKNVKVIRFVRNFGQTAALAAGIKYAQGDIIIPMDADLQNDPADIERLLAKLDEGYDVVSGWRKDRKDDFFTRTLPSWSANKLISLISGVQLHDYGCSLKAYRKEVLKDVRLYGEMHRFVPIYAYWAGAKVTEIPVTHHARKFGKSKYGIGRTVNVVLDLMTINFLSNYVTKPIHIFGSAGIWSFLISFAAFGWMLVLKYFYGVTFIETPLPILVAMFFMVGVQFILMGLLAEIVVRTYYETQDKQIYVIKSAVNIDS
jgi:glycosyltransferase involved in cell wall biosynthesis